MDSEPVNVQTAYDPERRRRKSPPQKTHPPCPPVWQLNTTECESAPQPSREPDLRSTLSRPKASETVLPLHTSAPMKAAPLEVIEATTASPEKAFDVKAAMDRVKIRARLATEPGITIFTLNMGGLRSPYKKESLRALAHHLQFTIGVITETHLLDPEVDALQIPNYRIIDKKGSSKFLGGVLILVRTTTSCRKFTRPIQPVNSIDTCSMVLHPTGAEDYAIQITGIYIPPSAKIDGDNLNPLLHPDCRARTPEGEITSHLLIGDFNPNCWAENAEIQYQEWIIGHGLWELADPHLPTFATGSSLDKILLSPGRDIPEEWLSPLNPTTQDEDLSPLARPFYPAEIFPEPWIDNHHPLRITLSGKQEEDSQPWRTLQINNLTQPEWVEKNQQFQEYWEGCKASAVIAIQQNNPTRLLDLITKGLQRIFTIRRKDPAKDRLVPRPAPLLTFCKRHLKHPDYPMLISAIQRNDSKATNRVMCNMTRDGWRSYLAETHPSNTSAFFRYLAKEDGRVSRQEIYSCMAPLLDSSGTRHFDGTQKCELLARHFGAKLGTPNHPQSVAFPMRAGAGIKKSLHRLTKPRNAPLPKPPIPGNLKPEDFKPFSAVEVYRAIHGLQKRKAPGPDGYMAEIYQNLPDTLPPLKDLFNLILTTGSIPLPMLKLHIVPLDKPQKNPEECGSKRPISLLNILSKALESLVLLRMVNSAGMEIDGRQYAYRSNRGTETHLTEVLNFIQAAKQRNERVYLAAVDVDSAFDSVSHLQLTQTVVDRGVDPHICRYIWTWLTKRLFSVRLSSPTGRHFSSLHPIGRGVPQGGILSPYLWLLHIDKLFREVESRRAQHTPRLPLSPTQFLDSLYADDILCAIASKDPEILARASHISAEAYKDGLKTLGLATTEPKSENFLMDTQRSECAPFKRAADPPADPLGRNAEDRPDSHMASSPASDGTPNESLPLTTEAAMESSRWSNAPLPYKQVQKIKVLGVILDPSLSFEDHFTRIMDKAKVRMGVLAKLSGSKWGLETRMLRLTGQALIISLVRYGYILTGSGLSNLRMSQLNTRLLNILARKIVGTGPSARLPVLFSLAGILNSQNLYVQQCAESLNLILRATDSSAQDKLTRQLLTIYAMPSWISKPQEMDPSTLTHPLIGRLRYLDYDVAESWMIQTLPACPMLPSKYWVRSVYHSDAKEIVSRPNLQALMYTFSQASSWTDVAIQVLTASGWRPDCSEEMQIDTTKILPPQPQEEKINIVETEPIFDSAPSSELIGDNAGEERCELYISASAFFQNGVGASIAWIQPPMTVPSIQVWGLGVDFVSSEPPAFILEASILHALNIVHTLLQESPATSPTSILITAGSFRTNMALADWQRTGTFTLKSAAAPEIAKIWHQLNATLQCPLRLRAVPRDFHTGSDPWDSSEGVIIKMAAKRFYEQGVPPARERWGDQIARIPWTTEELKKHLKRKYREDERTAIELLAMENSIASANYCKLGLNRALLKETLRRLQHNRRRQVVFANIICATRFKFFDETGTLLNVKCPLGCGEIDSLEHLIKCACLQDPDPAATFEDKANYLRTMAVEATKNCPILPTPIPPSPPPSAIEAGEISLDETPSPDPLGASPSSPFSDPWSLEFEFDRDPPES